MIDVVATKQIQNSIKITPSSLSFLSFTIFICNRYKEESEQLSI
jgi:hypothetical protein